MRGSPYRVPFVFCLLAFVSLTADGQKTAQPPSKNLTHADAAFRAGYAARQAGDLELARTKFSEVVRLQPQIVEGHIALGAVLVEMGKPDEGATEFEKAAKIKPSDDGIETNLAIAYSQAGAPARAIPHFQAAISLSHLPNHTALAPSFYDAYARALAAVGKPDEAVIQFVAEEALTGPRADIEDAIGTLYAQQARWQEAQQHFERALSIDQSYARARIHLGVLYRAQKDLVNSLNTLAPLAELNPPDPEALLEFGRTLASA